MTQLPRLKSGIDDLDECFDAWVDAIERGLSMRAGPGVIVENGPTGTTIKTNSALKFFVKLTGGGTLGAYTAVQVMPSATGGWTTFPSGWTGTVYEYNQVATLPVDGSHNVEVTYFGQSNDYRFQSGTC